MIEIKRLSKRRLMAMTTRNDQMFPFVSEIPYSSYFGGNKFTFVLHSIVISINGNEKQNK